MDWEDKILDHKHRVPLYAGEQTNTVIFRNTQGTGIETA